MSTQGSKTSHPGIRRLGRESWQLRVSLRDPRTAKKKDKTRVLENVDFATATRRWEELRDELQAQVNAALIQPERKVTDETLAAYAQRWLTHAEKTKMCRKHVLIRVSTSLEHQILPHLGHLLLSDINPQVLAKWTEQLSALHKPDGTPYAVETHKGAWRTLRSILNDARMLVGFKVDLAGFTFRVAGEPPKQKDVLTHPEVVAVLEAARHESPDVCTMIWLGFTTGMRFCELSALLWEDVNFETGVVQIRRSQVHGTVGPTKTGTHRSVTLLDPVRQMLLAHKERQKVVLVQPVVDGMLFPSGQGTYRTPSMLFKPLERCTAKAGVEKRVAPHTMRRTFNNLVRQAAGEIAARAMVGHATVEMTEHYSDVTVAEKRKAQLAAFGDLSIKLGGSSRWVSAEIGGCATKEADPQE